MKPAPESAAAAPDFAAIKQRQQVTWASGDFAVIGTTLQIVGELLAESVDVRAGERVLDIAAGRASVLPDSIPNTVPVVFPAGLRPAAVESVAMTVPTKGVQIFDRRADCVFLTRQ